MVFSSKTDFLKGAVIYTIESRPDKRRCPCCQSAEVTAVFLKERDFKALPVGRKLQIIRVRLHRLLCRGCGSYRQEPIAFVPADRARHTRSMERYVMGLRREMSIKAVADFTGLDWKTVKEIEKAKLKVKYRTIRLKDVKAIGIDEIYLGKKWKYKTIVIDLESGAVLYIGKGRGVDSLDGFQRKLRSSKCAISTVAVDMGPAYTKWARDNLSGAVIVYDHFHVIKLMNEKLDLVRRQEMAKARKADKNEEKRVADYCDQLTARALNRGIDQARIRERVKAIWNGFESRAGPLKGTKWLLLGNEERIRTKTQAAAALDRLTQYNENIAVAYQLKEQLRDVYREKDPTEATKKLDSWCMLADESGLKPMKTMAKTIRNHRQGVLAYWETGLTSAKVEGFNNKIRWLNKQAYGYRDEQYFELKVSQVNFYPVIVKTSVRL